MSPGKGKADSVDAGPYLLHSPSHLASHVQSSKQESPSTHDRLRNRVTLDVTDLYSLDLIFFFFLNSRENGWHFLQKLVYDYLTYTWLFPVTDAHLCRILLSCFRLLFHLMNLWPMFFSQLRLTPSFAPHWLWVGLQWRWPHLHCHVTHKNKYFDISLPDLPPWQRHYEYVLLEW